MQAVQMDLIAFQSAALPSGLNYIPNYIDASAERELIDTIDAQPWITELKRRVQHYGYRYDYKARNVTNASRLMASLSYYGLLIKVGNGKLSISADYEKYSYPTANSSLKCNG